MLQPAIVQQLVTIRDNAKENRIPIRVVRRNNKGDTAEFMALSNRQCIEVDPGNGEIGICFTLEQIPLDREETRVAWMKHLSVVNHGQPGVAPDVEVVAEVMKLVGFATALSSSQHFTLDQGNGIMSTQVIERE